MLAILFLSYLLCGELVLGCGTVKKGTVFFFLSGFRVSPRVRWDGSFLEWYGSYT